MIPILAFIFIILCLLLGFLIVKGGEDDQE